MILAGYRETETGLNTTHGARARIKESNVLTLTLINMLNEENNTNKFYEQLGELNSKLPNNNLLLLLTGLYFLCHGLTFRT